MPENTPMKMQWINIDGRSTPIVLPQIWDHEKQDWIVTGTENPLPTQVTGGIVEDGLPVSTVSSNKTKVIDSNIILPAGGYKTFNGLMFTGTRIGFGIRLSQNTDIRIMFQHTDDKMAISPQQKLFEGNTDRYAGAFDLHLSEGTFIIWNDNTSDVTLNKFVLTDFMGGTSNDID